MKKMILFSMLMGLSMILFAQQDYQDVVYLKNGSIIHGVIIEQVPNKSVKIETADKNVMVYQIDEIEKMTKEQKGNSLPKKDGTLNVQKDKKTGTDLVLNGGMQLPISDLGKSFDSGVGFSAMILFSEYKGDKRASAGGISVGYTTMKSKFGSQNINIIPITVVSESYFGKGSFQGIYGFDLGGYLFSGGGDSKTKFGAAAYFGIDYKISPKLSFVANAKYNYIIDFKKNAADISWIGFNIGLKYRLN